MNTIALLRGDAAGIPFSIVDPASTLSGKRVTWSVSQAVARGSAYEIVPPAKRIIRKVGGLPGTSADITINSQTANTITGTINLTSADYTLLPGTLYAATLWVDDGAAEERCVTPGGFDLITIAPSVPRSA